MTVRPSPEPEIDQVVLRRDLRHVEHLVDERLRRRHPDDVLAGLADLGLEWLRRLLGGLRERGRAGEERQRENNETAGQTCAHYGLLRDQSGRLSPASQPAIIVCKSAKFGVRSGHPCGFGVRRSRCDCRGASVARGCRRYKWVSLRIKRDLPRRPSTPAVAPSSVLVASALERRARRDHRRHALPRSGSRCGRRQSTGDAEKVPPSRCCQCTSRRSWRRGSDAMPLSLTM